MSEHVSGASESLAPENPVEKSSLSLSDFDSLSSPSIGHLAAALAKAQGEITAAKASTENPFFKSTYADLASVWDSIRGPLSKNGLAIVQQIIPRFEGANIRWFVQTVLAHSSGEWIKSYFPVMAAQQTSQGMGAATTYARRFGLNALVGVAQVEDDDGNSDSNRRPDDRGTSAPPAKPTTNAPTSAPSKTPAIPPSKAALPFTRSANAPRTANSTPINEPPFDDTPMPSESDFVPSGDPEPPTPPAGKLTLLELAKKRGLTEAMLEAACKKFLGKKTYKTLTKTEEEFIRNYLEKTSLEAFKRDLV